MVGIWLHLETSWFQTLLSSACYIFSFQRCMIHLEFLILHVLKLSCYIFLGDFMCQSGDQKAEAEGERWKIYTGSVDPSKGSIRENLFLEHAGELCIIILRRKNRIGTHPYKTHRLSPMCSNYADVPLSHKVGDLNPLTPIRP